VKNQKATLPGGLQTLIFPYAGITRIRFIGHPHSERKGISQPGLSKLPKYAEYTIVSLIIPHGAPAIQRPI
jgi:hypothetical protein